jgi:hypothetical protein
VIRSAILLLAASCFADPATLDSETTVEPSTGNVPGPRQTAAAPCGDAPLAACPLQSWMDARMAPTFKRGDFAALAAAFRELAGLGPEGWSGWPEIAEAGAAAARKGSVEEIRVACAACHARFRSRYRAELRPRPLPESRGAREER